MKMISAYIKINLKELLKANSRNFIKMNENLPDTYLYISILFVSFKSIFSILSCLLLFSIAISEILFQYFEAQRDDYYLVLDIVDLMNNGFMNERFLLINLLVFQTIKFKKNVQRNGRKVRNHSISPTKEPSQSKITKSYPFPNC